MKIVADGPYTLVRDGKGKMVNAPLCQYVQAGKAIGSEVSK